MNIVWTTLIILSTLISFGKMIYSGDPNSLNIISQSIFSNAKTAFELALSLTGVMALWLGIMEIAEKSGIVNFFGKFIRKHLAALFPSIPESHPSLDLMIVAFFANMIGLSNAATPLGLKAMKSLQTLNSSDEAISDSQSMFLVITSSSLTILPVSIFSLLYAVGYPNPFEFFLPILLASICSTVVGIFLACRSQNIKFFSTGVFYITAQLFFLLGFYGVFTLIMQQKSMNTIATSLGSILTLLFIAITILIGLIKGLGVYQVFIKGAKEGFKISIDIIPYLVAIFIAIGMLKDSQVLDLFKNILGDSSNWEVLPIGIFLPLSGGSTYQYLQELYAQFGVQSFISKMGTVMTGSTDTTLYIFALYLGSVKLIRSRSALKIALFSDLCGVISAIVFSYLFF